MRRGLKPAENNADKRIQNLVLNLLATLCFSEGHVEGDSRHNCLPSLIFRQTASFDRPPQINDFFFSYGLKKILISFPV